MVTELLKNSTCEIKTKMATRGSRVTELEMDAIDLLSENF